MQLTITKDNQDLDNQYFTTICSNNKQHSNLINNNQNWYTTKAPPQLFVFMLILLLHYKSREINRKHMLGLYLPILRWRRTRTMMWQNSAKIFYNKC